MPQQDSMKQQQYRATRMVNDIYGPVVSEMQADNRRMLPDQALEQYVKQFRNNPEARRQFVAQHYMAGNIDKRINPLKAEREYMQTMEAELRKKGGANGTQ